MAHVEMLIPEEEKHDWGHIRDERFDFTLLMQTDQGEMEQTVQPPRPGALFPHPGHPRCHGPQYEPAGATPPQIDTWQNPADIVEAATAALSFLDNHPQFLSYRFGYAEAEDLYASMQELLDLAQDASTNGQQMRLKPYRHYHDQSTNTDVTEIMPGVMHEM